MTCHNLFLLSLASTHRTCTKRRSQERSLHTDSEIFHYGGEKVTDGSWFRLWKYKLQVDVNVSIHTLYGLCSIKLESRCDSLHFECTQSNDCIHGLLLEHVHYLRFCFNRFFAVCRDMNRTHNAITDFAVSTNIHAAIAEFKVDGFSLITSIFSSEKYKTD